MYFCKPDIAEKWVEYSKSPSGVKGNFVTSSFSSDPNESYCYMIDKKYGDNLIADEQNEYIVGEKNKGLEIKFTEVIDGTLSAQKVFSEFKAKAKLN